MPDAANIQVVVHTSDAERADKVLKALQNTSDKLYQSLANLDKGSSFNKLNAAVNGVDTSLGRLKAANDSAVGSFAKTGTQATAAGRALALVDTQADATGRALTVVSTNSNTASRALTTIGTEGAKAGKLLDASFDDVHRSAVEAGRGVLDLDDATGDLVAQSGRYVDAAGRTREANGRYVRGADAATASTDRMATGYGKAKLAVAAMGVAIIAFAKQSLGASATFDDSMRTVQSKLLVTGEAMEVLRDQAKELGSTTQFSASEAADGMGFLAQAGLNAQEIMGAMPSVLNLAAGANISLAESADIATNVMGGFGQEVDDLPRIMDILAASSAKTNTSVGEMASAFVKSAPVASEFGLSVIDTAAAVGILADSGIKGERAGTVLTGMFRNLVNPVGEAAKVLDEAALSSDDLFKTMDDGSLSFIGMGEMMDLLSEKGIDGRDVLRLFGEEAGPGMLKILAQGSGGFEAYAAKIDIAGAAAKQAAIKNDGLGGAMRAMGSAWEAVQIKFGDSGGSNIAIAAFGKITEALQYIATDGIDYVVDKWDLFQARLQYNGGGYAVLRGLSSAFDDIGTALSPVLPYLGQFAAAAAGVVATVNGVALVGLAFTKVGAAIKGVGLVLAANPITLIIAAIGAAAYLIYDNWDGIEKWWGDMWSGIQITGADFFDWWNNTTLTEKYADIATTQFEISRSLIEGFFGWWDQSTLKEISPQIVVDAVDSAKQISEELFAWWDSMTFREKVVDVASDTLAAAYELGQEFVAWWDSIDLKSIIADIEMPSLDGLKGKADEVVGWFGEWGGDLVDSAAGGMANAKSAVVAMANLGDDILDEAQKKIKAGGEYEELGKNISKGFATGISGGLRGVETAALSIAEAPADTIRAENLIQSPSRLMMEMGRYVSEGFALGIENGAGLVVSAVEKLSKEGAKAFDRIKDGLGREILALTKGQEALERYDLEQKKVTGTHQDAIVALRDKRDALEEEREITERVTGQMAKLADEQHLQNIELTQGAEAAELAALRMDDYSQAEAESVVATRNAMEAQQAFSDTLGKVFDAVLDGQNPLKEIEQIGKAWLRDMISMFANNKVVAYFTGEGATGVKGMFDDVVGSMKSMFTGSAQSAGVLAQAAQEAKIGLDAFGGAGSGAGGALGSLTSGLSAMKANFIASAGPIAAIAAAAVIFRSALGGTAQQVASGFRVGFAEGSVVGDNVAFWEKEKSFWRGTKMWEEYSELSKELADQVGEYMGDMHTSVVATASALGIDGAQMIMDNYSLAVKTFRGENAEAELAKYLEEATTQAYKLAFDELGPELKGYVEQATGAIEEPVMELAGTMGVIAGQWEEGEYIISEASKLHNQSIKDAQGAYEEGTIKFGEQTEEMRAIMEEMAAAAVYGVPALEALGFAMGETSAQAIISTTEMAEAFGGVAPMMQRLTLYANEFTPAADTVSANLLVAKQGLEAFSEGLGLNTVAAGNAQVMIGDLRASLDLATPAGQAANDELNALAVTFGVASSGTIDTREKLVAYIDELKRQAEAGSITTAQLGEMTNAALSNMEAIMLVEDAMIAQKLTLDTVTEAARMLNLNFDASAPSANAFSTELVNLMGGLDAFTEATNHYFQNYFTLEEQQDFALAKTAEAVLGFNNSLTAAQLAAAGVTDGVIDTEAELRRYIETLDATDPANAQAIATAIGVSQAMSALDETGQGLESTIDGLPANLTASFDTMTTAGDDTASSMEGNASTIDIATGVTETSFGSLANAMTFLANASAAAAGVAGSAAQAAASQSTAAYNEAIAAGASHADAIVSANGAYNEAISAGQQANVSAAEAGDSSHQADLSAASAQRSANSAHLSAVAWESMHGSHAGGLDSVPFDGYRGLLHKDEMVSTAPVSDQLRSLGVTSTSVPDWMTSASNVTPINNSISVSAPAVSIRNNNQNNDAEIVAELRAVRKELESIKAENRQASKDNVSATSAVISNTGRQVKATEDASRTNERLIRKIPKAAA